MSPAGSSLDAEGELTIFFKHKNKIAYAIKEPYQMVQTDNGEQGTKPYNKDMKLIISSKDKSSISSIVILDDGIKTSKNISSFYGIEKTEEYHELDSLIEGHSKWHIIDKIKSLSNISEVQKLHLYNVNSTSGISTVYHIALLNWQEDYVTNYIGSLSDLYYELATIGNSSYSTISKKTRNDQTVYYYPDGGTDFFIIHDVTDTHAHHFHRIPMRNNPSAVRSLFGVGP